MHNYSYSYANQIGVQLTNPLFKLALKTVDQLSQLNNPHPENLDPLPSRIVKVASILFLDLLLLVPATIAYLGGKTLIALSSRKIDRNHLADAPAPLAIPNEEELRNISLTTSLVDLDSSLWGFCSNITENNSTEYKQLELHLKFIVKKITTPSFDQNRKEMIIERIKLASQKCHPTWFQEAYAISQELVGANSVENTLLLYVESYKENLILETSQNELNLQWHALNAVKKLIGAKIGLRPGSSEQDPFSDLPSSVWSGRLIKWFFMQKYQDTNRLVASIKTQIESEHYDPNIFDFLVNKVEEKKNISKEKSMNFVIENFYLEDEDFNYHIKEEAICFMLKEIGILT